jgi:hypothetical protein
MADLAKTFERRKRTPNFGLLLAAICLASVVRAALEIFRRHDLIGIGD